MEDKKLLQKIRRSYSNQEVVALIDKELKKVEFENGVLVSEVAELKELLICSDKKGKKIINQAEHIKWLDKKNKRLAERIIELTCYKNPFRLGK